jgi:hypothetical protein
MVFKVNQDWGNEEKTLTDDDLKIFLGRKTASSPVDRRVQDNIWHLTHSFETEKNKGLSTACSFAKSRPFHNILTPFSRDGCFTAPEYPRTCLF